MTPRALVWEGGSLPAERPSVMAILNVTPDSFFDGGRYDSVEQALARAWAAHSEGADVLDIGGESTRPGAPEVSLHEEIDRVLPVLEALRARDYPLPISIDTTHSEVAEAALGAGARIVNDVSGGRADPRILQVAARHGAAVVLMHMRGTPRTMQLDVHYEDLVREVVSSLAASCEAASAAGIPPEHQAVDPGIGFGKGPEDCLRLIRGIDALDSLERPVLVGASRKSFLGKLFGTEPGDRLVGSLVVAAASVDRGASILRVHDVGETRPAVDVATDAVDRLHTTAERASEPVLAPGQTDQAVRAGAPDAGGLELLRQRRPLEDHRHLAREILRRHFEIGAGLAQKGEPLAVRMPLQSGNAARSKLLRLGAGVDGQDLLALGDEGGRQQAEGDETTHE